MAENVVQLGDLSDLPNGQTRAFPQLGDHGVVICRVAGQLHAVTDNCSHCDAKLSPRDLTRTAIRRSARTGAAAHRHRAMRPPIDTIIREGNVAADN